MPLGDITNTHTPQHRYHKNSDDMCDHPKSAQEKNDSYARIEPFQNGFNMFGNQCWDTINNQQAQTEE